VSSNYADFVPSDYSREIGRRVRVARERAGLSQLALAQKANLTPALIMETERGEASIALIDLVAVAVALGLDARDLLPDTPSDKPNRGGSNQWQ
jgi:transcriptional regulator with XRE-family HTH domain